MWNLYDKGIKKVYKNENRCNSWKSTLGASLNYIKRMIDEIHKEYSNKPFIWKIPPYILIKFPEKTKSISKEKFVEENLNSILFVDQIFLYFEGYLNG